jgi:hypothetical protein
LSLKYEGKSTERVIIDVLSTSMTAYLPPENHAAVIFVAGGNSASALLFGVLFQDVDFSIVLVPDGRDGLHGGDAFFTQGFLNVGVINHVSLHGFINKCSIVVQFDAVTFCHGTYYIETIGEVANKPVTNSKRYGCCKTWKNRVMARDASAKNCAYRYTEYHIEWGTVSE